MDKSERDIKKREFSEYVNEMLMKYELSEAKLGEALNFSQKSINRYRNANTYPDAERRRLIKKYFEKVEKEALEPGERYPAEEDFYVHIPFQPDLSDPGEAYDPLEDERVWLGQDLLRYYVPEVQKYIVNHMDVYWLISEYEMNLIEKVHALSDSARERLIHYLQELPESMDALMVGNDSESTIFGECYHKIEGYQRMVYELTSLKGAIHNKISKKTNKPVGKRNEQAEIQYQCLCQDLYEQTGTLVKENFFVLVNQFLQYTKKEWYFLYLLARLQIADLADKKNYYHITPGSMGSMIGIREDMLLHYIDLLENM